MKSLIIKTFLLVAIAIGAVQTAGAQVQIDAATNAAVILQTEVVGGELSDINDNQTAIIGQNAVIMATTKEIRDYEEIMFDYLSKTHNLFTSATQVVMAIQKGSDIINELNECRKATVDHPEGAVVSAIVSKEYNKILQESSSLVGNVTTLVKSGGKQNLLNSAERLQILYSINTQLYNIYSSLRKLRWNILCYKWSDIPRLLSPELYYGMINNDRAYRNCLRMIDDMRRAF